MEPNGATILFDAGDGDTSPFVRLSGIDNAYTFEASDLCFKASANAQQAGRNGIEFDGVGISNVVIQRCEFCEIPGYAVKVTGDIYLGHPLVMRDCFALRCGGLIQVYSANCAYIAGQVTVENCVLEQANTTTGLCDPVVDLRSAGMTKIQQLLVEGADAKGVNIIGLSERGSHHSVEGYYSEWPTKPMSDIRIYHHPREDIYANTTYDLRDLKLESPVMVDVSRAHIEISHVFWLNAANRIDDLVKFAQGTFENSVKLSNVGWDAGSATIGKYLGHLIDANNIGRITGGGFIRKGAGFGYSLDLPDSVTLYEWTADRGPMSQHRTRYVEPYSTFVMHGAGDVLTVDASEGRVARFTGSPDKYPYVRWSWDYPPSWDHVGMTAVARYRLEAVGSPTGGVLHLTSNSGDRAANTLFTTLEQDGKWHTAIFQSYDMANTGGQICFKAATNPAGGSYNLYVSHLWVGLGHKLIMPTGMVAGNQPITWRGTSCPTDANWVNVIGDTIFNARPGAGEPSQWVYDGVNWTALGTIPGAVAKAADYAVTAADNGKRFSNSGASRAVTFVLPVDAANLEYEFIAVASSVLKIKLHDGIDHFVGRPGGKYLELGQYEKVRIGRYAPDTWFILEQVGTPRYEP